MEPEKKDNGANHFVDGLNCWSNIPYLVNGHSKVIHIFLHFYFTQVT